MGRAPCCDKANVKKGPWSPEEDAKLKDYIEKSGTGGNWISLPQKAGLRRCGKSCRLRWLNYLRPNIKHGDFSDSEDNIICSLYANIGSRWSIIAAQLPGRTDNDIKNYWNTKLKKKLMGIKNINYPKFTPSESVLTAHDQPSSLTSSYNQADQSNYYTNPGFESYANVSSALFDSSYSAQVHQGIQDGLLRFGSEAASCSSSDGSSNTQISREAVQGNGYGAVDFPDYLYNGFDTKTIDYGLEEIKQLISTNLNSDFFLDEIKTEEKMAY